MNRYTSFASIRLLLAVSLGLSLAGPALAQKGKGGGGSSPSFYYRVTAISLNLTHYIRDLNGSSEAVGYVRTPEKRNAFLWTKELGMVPLQSLLSETDQQLWHLEIAEVINDFGQIAGQATVKGGDQDQTWAAFRLDCPNGWLNGATLTILEERYTYNSDATIRISNLGDVIVSSHREPSLYYYPPDYPASSKVDVNYPAIEVFGINSFGEIIVYDDQSYSRLTLDLQGGFDNFRFETGNRLSDINDAGTILGWYQSTSGKYSSFPYQFRYTDQSGIVALKDGKNIIADTRLVTSFINESGDVALRGSSGPAIHTAAGAYLQLNSLIHPDDATDLTGYIARGIASRNETGLPAVIVDRTIGSTGGTPN